MLKFILDTTHPMCYDRYIVKEKGVGTMYKEDQVIDDYLSGRIGTASFLEIICTVSDYYMNIWDTIDRMEGCLMCDFTSDRWRIPAAVDL